MDRKKMIYIGSLLILTAIISIASFSYAIWSNKSEQRGKLNIVAGTLDYQLVSADLVNNSIIVPANTNKTIEIEITSLNNIESKYELYYTTNNQNISIGYSEETIDNPTGTISSRSSKKVTVIIKNKSDSPATITFGCQGGFSGKELVLAQGDSITEQINSCIYDPGKVWDFPYNGTTGADGSVQNFDVPCDGYYRVELWGAQGGTAASDHQGGYGGYTSGSIPLSSDDELYIYVGGKGTSGNSGTISGGYNGGYTAVPSNSNYSWRIFGSGGGATDIRLVGGTWDNLDSLKSRIMVAAGGGGSFAAQQSTTYAGDAGGLVGYDAGGKFIAEGLNSDFGAGYGATQTAGGAGGSAGSFGQGGKNGDANGYTTGGSGYYGGGSSYHVAASGGGSSYISGHNGCVAIESSQSLNPRFSNNVQCDNGTTDIECSKHYLGYVFINTLMIDGQGYRWTTSKDSSIIGQPQPDGTTANGHSDNGYARITYLGEGSTVTLYSAAGDEVYFKDTNDNKVVIGITDSTGKLENAFIPDGVTLYSTVAKDPNNLSNPYSEVVNKENGNIYLMPDGNILYWYGYDQFTNPLKTTFLGRPFKDAVNVKNTNSWQLTLNGSGTTGLNSCMYVTQDFIDSTNLSSYNIIVNSGSLDLYSRATTVEMDYYTTTDVVRGPSCYHEPVTSPVLWTMDISEVDSVKPGIQLQTQNPSYLATVTIAAMWLE